MRIRETGERGQKFGKSDAVSVEEGQKAHTESARQW